jgi:hypothetical protein
MRFSTLSAAAAILSLGFAAPASIPGVNLTAISGAAADVIKGSYLIQYKDGTTKQQVEAHTATFPATIGTAAEAVYSLGGLSITHVKTDDVGIAKIGTASIVSFLMFALTMSLTRAGPPCRT